MCGTWAEGDGEVDETTRATGLVTWVIRFGAAVFVIVCAVLWSAGTATGELGYAGPLLDPGAWDGEVVTISLAHVEALGPDGFEISKGVLRFMVHGSTEGLAVGQEVDLSGIWRARTRTLELSWVEVARGREAKRVLGVVGLLVIGVLAPLGLRWSARGLMIRG